MKRGEVWWTDFSPAVGGEIHKERPAVIVSNDDSNLHLNRMQVVPLTTSTQKVYRARRLCLSRIASTKQWLIRSPQSARTASRIALGKLSADDLRKVEQVIKIQLGLDL